MTITPAATRAADRPVRQLSVAASALWDRFPPRPILPVWETTGRDRASVFARLVAAPFPVENHRSQLRRRGALTKVLDWLDTLPGQTWQERWDASGAGVDGRIDWRLGAAKDLEKTGLRTADGRVVLELGVGLSQLICGDVLRPSQRWLLATPSPRDLCGEMARVRDPDGFAALAAVSEDGMVARNTTGVARQRVAVIMAAKGGRVCDITPGDCLELMKTSDLVPSWPGASGVFYQLLHAAGFFPADAPPTVRMFNPAFHGQSSVEHLVDRYHLTSRPIRDLLVAYLRERQPAVDYGSLTHLATTLVSSFWKDLENHHPGIDSLRLAPDVAAAWKQRLQTRTARTTGVTDTKVARLATSGVLMTVRSFYLDIAQWSGDDPARWGPWVVPCPIRDADIRYGQDQSHRKSRMDARTRERLPGLPVLVTAVDRARTEAATLLTAAAATNPGELVTAAGQRLRRTRMSMPTPRVWAEDPDTGKRRDLTREEDNAFWSWAIIEVLRGTGCRVEELTEISHHSLVQYRLPTTGELIPLLQIAPSKTDQERLLVVSPELADVFSAILHRIRTTTGAVPMVALYDTCERVWNPPMPLLFQRIIGLENRPIGINGTRRLIQGTLTHSGLTDAAGMPLPFLPHDFRRLFTTDAVMNGMPPHIAQLILGHKNINTTMGYKAVYPEEAINGHRAFIARRRELRPSEEYRTPTDEEWEEFLGHFERRRVALGDCGRAYSTPCIHEHSCLRCSLLRPDPSQRSRLVDIRNNLRERITEARQQHWLGEVAGLEVSLAAATAKLDQMDGITARRDATVQLGIPTFTPAATHTTTSASKETR